ELARMAKQPIPIACLRFLPGDKALVSLSGAHQADGAIQFWDIGMGKETNKVVIPKSASRGLAIAPDGKTVAVEALVQMREKQGDVTKVYWARCIRMLDAATG